MIRDPHLRLLERIKNPPIEGPISTLFWRVFGVIIFPIVLILGLILMAVAGIISVWNRSVDKLMNRHSDKGSSIDDQLNQWHLLFNCNDLSLYRKNIGGIRFGPGYFWLKSTPEVVTLSNQKFGDWTFQVDAGVLLQRWNSLTKPDTDLVLLDTKSLTLRTIATNIPSVQWEIARSSENDLLLTCNTGGEKLKYQLTL